MMVLMSIRQSRLYKHLDDHYASIVLTTTIVLLGLWGYTEYADGAYCAATCQARLAGEEKAKTSESSTKKTEKSCYGIYCDREEKDDIEDQIQAYKDSLKNRIFISIRVSEACQISDTCPSVKELADMYDNSNKFLSGDFNYDVVQGKWVRENPRAYNVFENYKFLDYGWVVFVDPDHYTWDRTKQIMIESQLHYVDRKDLIENQVRKEYRGLNVDGCSGATVGWKDGGMEILNDVLNHFYSGCKQQMEFDPTIEIFMNSTIFPECDRECFYYLDQVKTNLKVDYLLEIERWADRHCDEDHKHYNDQDLDTLAECKRIDGILGESSDDDRDEPCYGIYCDREEEDDDKDKTAREIHAERVQELEDIGECKDEQNWDETKIKGDWRRNFYDCEDEDDREEYFDILKCEASYNEDVDCNDEDEREEELKRIAEDLPFKFEIELCEDLRSLEMTIDNQTRKRAEIVTCEDQFERDEYLQEMKIKYPERFE